MSIPPKKSGVRKSWHGRLTAQADAATAELLSSLDVDAALWRYDLVGSLAHAAMLAKTYLAEVRQQPAGDGQDLDWQPTGPMDWLVWKA